MSEKAHKHRHKSQRHQPVNKKNLLAATLMNLIITVVEVADHLTLQFEFDPNHAPHLIQSEKEP